MGGVGPSLRRRPRKIRGVGGGDVLQCSAARPRVGCVLLGWFGAGGQGCVLGGYVCIWVSCWPPLRRPPRRGVCGAPQCPPGGAACPSPRAPSPASGHWLGLTSPAPSSLSAGSLLSIPALLQAAKGGILPRGFIQGCAAPRGLSGSLLHPPALFPKLSTVLESVHPSISPSQLLFLPPLGQAAELTTSTNCRQPPCLNTEMFFLWVHPQVYLSK